MDPAPHLASRINYRAAIAAAAIQLVVGYALVTGLAGEVAGAIGERLEVISIPAQPTPTPTPPPAPDSVDAAQGEAAPPGRKAEPTEIAAPPPKLVVVPPPPVAVAPVAGTGSEAAAGAALAGAGTGAAGSGAGTGAGGTGRGAGSGGGRKAQRVAGALRDSDYPDEAARVSAEGTTFIRFTVTPEGRVVGCRITRSSGYDGLDQLTCRLAERRFRYRPALDAEGRAVAETVSTNFTWGTRF